MNLAEQRIPAFLSRLHHAETSKEGKARLLEQKDIWKGDKITKEYKLHLEKQLELLLKEDEEKTDWLSVFHWKYKKAHNKGKRTILRSLIKQLS